MKPQPQLASMLKNQSFDGFLLVRAARRAHLLQRQQVPGHDAVRHLREVNAKMWDGNTPAPAPATVLRLRGVMLEYNGRPQLRVGQAAPAAESDDFDMSALAPCAPQPSGEMMDFILNRVDAIADRELKALVLKRLEEAGDRLLYYPAASKLHHAERGGLLPPHLDDAARRPRRLRDLSLPRRRPSGCGRDPSRLCKLDELAADEIGMVSDYTREGQLFGPSGDGRGGAGPLRAGLGVRAELTAMLEHMILSHHDLPEYGSPRRPMFPEAEVLHILDVLDARMFEMRRELSMVKPGGFTERIWSLERKLYRRKEAPVHAGARSEEPVDE